MDSGIYQITNNINGKIYIGSTRNFITRWSGHKSIASKCVKLRNAIQKYGSDNFHMTILECVDVIGKTRKAAHTLLMVKEQFYLDDLQPFDNNGYNIHRSANGSYGTPHTESYKKSITGGNSSCAKAVTKYSTTGEMLREYGSIQEAADQNPPASVKRIIECCTNRAITTGGAMWAYHNQPVPIPRSRFRGVSVMQLCKETENIIAIFPSVKQAATTIGCWETDIVSVCKKQPHKHSAGGYRWCYAT